MSEPDSNSSFDTIVARHDHIEARDLAYLTARFPDLATQAVALNMNRSTPSFFDELVEGFAKGRRGEVLLALRHRDGRIWLHTKDFYPAGAYRLPTGGIEESESALDAARRELWEEAGLRAEPVSCAGILRYRLTRSDHSMHYISYLFLFDGDNHTPAPQDAGEGISDFKLIPIHTLPDVANSLKRTPSRWQDWGNCRAPAHDFLYECLQNSA